MYRFQCNPRDSVLLRLCRCFLISIYEIYSTSSLFRAVALKLDAPVRKRFRVDSLPDETLVEIKTSVTERRVVILPHWLISRRTIEY